MAINTSRVEGLIPLVRVSSFGGFYELVNEQDSFERSLIMPLMSLIMTLTWAQVRNPWGDKQEWRGTWADGGKEWNFIPDEVIIRPSSSED